MVGNMMKTHAGKNIFVLVSFLVIFFCPQILATEYTIGLATWSGYPQCVQGFN